MTAPTTGPRIKVLIAEDEEHLGTILEQFLLGRGYQVTVTRDGASALAALRSEAYDVALLDIVMPEMDGLEVLRNISEDAAHPEVIIITGNGTIETAISAMKLGAYDYMATSGSGGLAAIGGGISEALATTALGLLVAIPAVWGYNYFQTKIDNLTVEMTYVSKEMIDYLIKGVSGEFGRSRFTREFNAAGANAPIST